MTINFYVFGLYMKTEAFNNVNGGLIVKKQQGQIKRKKMKIFHEIA